MTPYFFWEVEQGALVLDVTFKEDDGRIRCGDGTMNVAVIRRFALNLAQLHPQKNSIRGKLRQAGWSDKFREEIIFGQNYHKVCGCPDSTKFYQSIISYKLDFIFNMN